MQARVELAETTGKAVLASMPARADVADALLAKCFSTPVAAFRAAAARALAPRKAHAELVATGEAVHALLVDGVADFRALEFWISTRVPPVSDGNNFGVEVQNYVIEQLKAYRVSLAALTEALATYHSSRAAALEKLGGAATTIETSAVESTESKVEEGKGKESKGSKLDKTTKTTTKEDSDDQRAHIVELDVRHYVALEGMVRELSQSYVKAHALVEKNREKCEFPRGAETGGGRMNSMY
ncbi:hypothetical protein KFE25_006517 [Diacronema lutheri]|uniref:Proteasome activator PA28 C-terminal domain-containing protein n=1 Tax=Diacronema lutheri TaxID=2081491 RepID=A0A8J5XE03_DIALT|nr:hypothetical protein KFE25_006517 [Diacronema lutheri]